MKIGNFKFDLENRTAVVGIVNLTDDSFSGDGIGTDINKALNLIKSFTDNGVDIIDIGAESTRPKSLYKNVVEVSENQEINRVVELIEKLRKISDIPISIDTRKSKVALEAVSAGANIINDISMLKYDEEMVEVVRNTGIPYILTHNKPLNNNNSVAEQVKKDLIEKINFLNSNGINSNKIIIDPGFGFNKNVDQNIELHRNLEQISSIGLPVLVGTSRKSFLGKIADGASVSDREEVSMASVVVSKEKGAKLFRVHDAVAVKNLLDFIEKLS
jgi:dihydropteroate synthase